MVSQVCASVTKRQARKLSRAVLGANEMKQTLSELMTQRFGLPASAGPVATGAESRGALETLLDHRSHRRFLPRAIDSELLQVLLAAALSAPSKSDLQQASVIVVRDASLRKDVQALTPSMPWLAEAGLLLVFCGDNRRVRRIAELRGKPFPNDTLDMFMNAAVDAGMVMQAFVTAAESVGLGCCPLSLLRNQVERLGELLAIPQGVFPVAGLAVGYPLDKGRISMRLPPAITVHENRYDASQFEAELVSYDARRAASEPPPRQKYTERWGTVDVYTWSEDKARQYSVPERHTFGPYIRGQGFALD